MRRALALWLLLFAVYAATLGLDAVDGSRYGGDEPHYLLATESLEHDRDVDVADEYPARAYEDFHDGRLAPMRRAHRRAGSTSRTASASRC